jgi:hypothetical protein
MVAMSAYTLVEATTETEALSESLLPLAEHAARSGIAISASTDANSTFGRVAPTRAPRRRNGGLVNEHLRNDGRGLCTYGK